MKSKATLFTVLAVVVLVCVMIQTRHHDTTAVSQSIAALPSAAGAQTVVTPVGEAGAAAAAVSAPCGSLPVEGVSVTRTPAAGDRPYIRLQINSDRSVVGVFATKCEPVKQARSVRIGDGYYYRVVSEETGEVLMDGAVAAPVRRYPHQGVDHGYSYIECKEEPSNEPVLFDIPNQGGRLQIFETRRGEFIAGIAKEKTPIVDTLIRPM